MIVTILIMANQNSSSPNTRTATMLSPVSNNTTHRAGIHLGKSGNHRARYPQMAVVSAMPITTQHIQYVQPM